MKRLASAAVVALLLIGHAHCTELADNVKLAKLYEQDQAERGATNPDWSVVMNHDRARSAAVDGMLKSGKVKTAKDYFHAANILIHGQTLRDMQLSYATSSIAVDLAPDNRKFKELNACAWDRIMLWRNRPQWYGTQYHRDSSGVWELDTLDADVFTDSERFDAGGRTLTQIDDLLADMRLRDSMSTPPANQKKPASGGTPSSTNQNIIVEYDKNTMRRLAAQDPSLGLIWFQFSRRGFQFDPATPSEKFDLSFLGHDTQEIEEIIDGTRDIAKVGNGGPDFGYATFVEYSVAKSDGDRLVLDITYDDKVQPGPMLKPNYYKHYRIIVKSMGEGPQQVAKFESVAAVSS